MKTFTKQTANFSYIDSVANARYFAALNLVRAKDKRALLQESKYLNTALFLYLMITYSSIDETVVAQELSESSVMSALERQNILPAESKRISSLFERYQTHMDIFPSFTKREVGAALVELIESSLPEFLASLPELNDDVRTSYKRLIIRHKPLLYVKLIRFL